MDVSDRPCFYRGKGRLHGSYKRVGDLDPDGNRFEDNKRIEGTIPEMLQECLAFLQRNLVVSMKVDKLSGKRLDTFELPMDAVREVVLNALVHRDYSIHTEGMPIQVELYPDRLEVSSPGGLYGRLTVDMLGKVQPDTRNPVLTTAMEVLGLTENRYSGIPTVRKAMAGAGHPDPEFIDTGSEFRVVLRMGPAKPMAVEVRAVKTGASSAGKKELAVLEFCKEPKSRGEIAEMLGVDEYYAARRYINPLVGSGALARTIPAKPRSKNQRYVKV